MGEINDKYGTYFWMILKQQIVILLSQELSASSISSSLSFEVYKHYSFYKLRSSFLKLQKYTTIFFIPMKTYIWYNITDGYRY